MHFVNSTWDLLNCAYCLLKVEMHALKKKRKKKPANAVKCQSKRILILISVKMFLGARGECFVFGYLKMTWILEKATDQVENWNSKQLWFKKLHMRGPFTRKEHHSKIPKCGTNAKIVLSKGNICLASLYH